MTLACHPGTCGFLDADQSKSSHVAAQQRRPTASGAMLPCCHGSHATHAHPPAGRCAAQAYKYWLQGDHPFLFLVNNDVLVPSGVLTKLMDGMRDDGAGNTGCDVLVSVLCPFVPSPALCSPCLVAAVPRTARAACRPNKAQRQLCGLFVLNAHGCLSQGQGVTSSARSPRCAQTLRPCHPAV